MRPLVLLLTLGWLFSCQSEPEETTTVEEKPMSVIPTAPVARKIPKTLSIHGDDRQDNYYWLRDDERKNEEMLAYLRAENAYTKSVMAHTEDLQETLFQEMKNRIKEKDESVPYFLNGYWYFTRYERGREYPIYCRKKGSMEVKEAEVLLDANERAKGHEYYRAGNLEVSPNQKILAFAEDTVSRRIYTIRFRNLETNETYPEAIEGVDTDLAWADDNQTLFYVRRDPTTLRSFQIFRHKLGTLSKDDVMVYEETDETFYLGVSRSRSNKYISIRANSTLTDQTFLLKSDDPEGQFKAFIPREKGHEYSVSHLGDNFYIRTNWKANNFRLMKVSEDAIGDKKNWKEVVLHRKDVYLEGFQTFTDYLVLDERENGLTQLRVMPLNEEEEYFIEFNDPTYTAGIGYTPEQNTDKLRYSYSSPTTPNTVYEHDLKTKERTQLKQTEVLGAFDPNNYVSERHFATARDGVKVPISLVYRKGTPIDSTASLYVYAYGSYGSSTEAYFSSTRLSLLDRGFVFAIAHIRGGEEMGRAWYEDGKLLNKKNTFTDFVDCTKYLIEKGYGDENEVFAMGGSAGGLLMGAVANMNPELYQGIIAHVPFVDVVTTMLDETIPLTTFEYDEWGNPNEKKYYEYMLSYSPYDQVEAKDYPNMLVTAGLHDSQVQYWEPAKWVAKLRDKKTDDNRLLLQMNMEAGHGGASGRFRRLRETALEYAFILDLIKE